jgi:hypothetical protein
MRNMPLFSTTEPGFMGSAGSDVFHLHLEGETSIFFPHGVKFIKMYFDGETSDIMGYDIPHLLSGAITGVDGQECEVIDPEGEYHTAYLNLNTDMMGGVVWYIQSTKGGK